MMAKLLGIIAGSWLAGWAAGMAGGQTWSQAMGHGLQPTSTTRRAYRHSMTLASVMPMIVFYEYECHDHGQRPSPCPADGCMAWP